MEWIWADTGVVTSPTIGLMLRRNCDMINWELYDVFTYTPLASMMSFVVSLNMTPTLSSQSW